MNELQLTLLTLILACLAGCSTIGKEVSYEPPANSVNPMQQALDSVPRLDGPPITVAVYNFTDYTGLENELVDVSTVLWALGTSSLNVDEATYTLIHVDFPAAFVRTWLSARQAAGNIDSPMAYHFIAGMGTDSSDAPWAHDKRKTERDVAAMAEGTGLRSFSYRSAYIRPISETTNVAHHITEALLRPGKLVTSSKELGQAMLEISARTKELANGTLLDNGDSIAYSKAYLLRLPKGSD